MLSFKKLASLIAPPSTIGEKHWQRRMLRSLLVMTGLGLAAALAPSMLGEAAGFIVQVVMALALVGMAWAII